MECVAHDAVAEHEMSIAEEEAAALEEQFA